MSSTTLSIESTTTVNYGNISTTPEGGYDDCVGTKFMTYPSAVDFLFSIFYYDTYFAYFLCAGIALYIIVFIMFCKLMYECWKIQDENIRGDIILCLATPFIVSTTCLISVIFPRGSSQMTTFGVSYMMFALWRALALIFRLYGDTDHMSDVMMRTGTRVRISVIPLCCCCCLPLVEPTLKTINIFKYLVLQTPPVRLTILAIIDVIRTEGYCDYTPGTKILNWIDSISTFVSLYASSVFVDASNKNLLRYKIGPLMRGVTLSQTIFNLQRIVMERLSDNDYVIPDIYFDQVNGYGMKVLEARVQADFWYNIVMILWLALISIMFLITMRPAASELFTMKRIPIAHVDTHGNFPNVRSIAPSVLTIHGGVKEHPNGSVANSDVSHTLNEVSHILNGEVNHAYHNDHVDYTP